MQKNSGPWCLYIILALLRSTGCYWWNHWLCKSRQCAVPGSWDLLWEFSRPGCLSAVSGSQELLGFPSYFLDHGIMGVNFYHSGKFMPGGLITGTSLLMVAKLGISMLNRPQL
uniref:Uncharacterized protein n=1 Tax=Urocitellus parryii TaxID=9999 RepID=A0A8D2KLH6_UROPR